MTFKTDISLNVFHCLNFLNKSLPIRWWMLLCLIFAWVITFLIIMKGIQSSGKVVYFTALFPYVVMTIFFIRGLTLKGAGAGLAHMFLPMISKMPCYNLLDQNLKTNFQKVIILIDLLLQS